MQTAATSTAAATSASAPEQQEQVEIARRVGDDRLQRPFGRRDGPARSQLLDRATDTGMSAASALAQSAASATERATSSHRDATARHFGHRVWPVAPASPVLVSGWSPCRSRSYGARRPCRASGAVSGRPARLGAGLAASTPARRPSSRSCRPNISALLVRLGVVVAEQVQDAVHGRAGAARPRCGARPPRPASAATSRAQHDVAEQGRAPAPVVVDLRPVPAPQLVHREGQHVGRARLVHPLLVQLGHRPRRRPAGPTARPAGGSPSRRARTAPAPRRLDSSTSTPDSLAISMLIGAVYRPSPAGPRRSSCAGGRSAPARVVRVVPLVGVDDLADQPVADDVGAGQRGRSGCRRCRRGCPAPPAARCACRRAGRPG